MITLAAFALTLVIVGGLIWSDPYIRRDRSLWIKTSAPAGLKQSNLLASSREITQNLILGEKKPLSGFTYLGSVDFDLLLNKTSPAIESSSTVIDIAPALKEQARQKKRVAGAA
jgi:hypothetical protein